MLDLEFSCYQLIPFYKLFVLYLINYYANASGFDLPTHGAVVLLMSQFVIGLILIHRAQTHQNQLYVLLIFANAAYASYDVQRLNGAFRIELFMNSSYLSIIYLSAILSHISRSNIIRRRNQQEYCRAIFVTCAGIHVTQLQLIERHIYQPMIDNESATNLLVNYLKMFFVGAKCISIGVILFIVISVWIPRYLEQIIYSKYQRFLIFSLLTLILSNPSLNSIELNNILTFIPTPHSTEIVRNQMDLMENGQLFISSIFNHIIPFMTWYQLDRMITLCLLVHSLHSNEVLFKKLFYLKH
ncbi:hypothetical protein SNEBB_006564 [Seison nebaliae]|nr:hypothetical protein SNEBB_006564 [Seison nebaliae]